MSAARLTQLRLRNFKSIGPEEQTVDIKPLTVLVGRNNSGKSAVLQGLLLLKQTLEEPRPDVEIALKGAYLSATTLRELTHDWPEEAGPGRRPEIALRWVSAVDRETFRRASVLKGGIESAGIRWPAEAYSSSPIAVDLKVELREHQSIVSVASTSMNATWWPSEHGDVSMVLGQDAGGSRVVRWGGGRPGVLFAEVDHFIPRLDGIAARELEPDEDDELLEIAFDLIYSDALDQLKALLAGVTHVGAARSAVPPYFDRPTSLPAKNVSPDGSNAVELLIGLREAAVNLSCFPGPLSSSGFFELPVCVASRPLADALNAVLRHLGIHVDLSLSESPELGLFRVLSGRAPLHQLGRGIGQLLPILVATLVADPLLGQGFAQDTPLADYLGRCEYFPVLTLEDVEGHLHPRVHARVAELLLALARSGRRLIVETHSDHVVRRLYGLMARTAPGSESEAWLKENVNIVAVGQTADGVTYLEQASLSRDARSESWPSDLLDG